MLFIIEVRKNKKWVSLIEVSGRLSVYELTSVFYSEKDAEKYAAQYFGWEQKKKTEAYSDFRIVPIEAFERMI